MTLYLSVKRCQINTTLVGGKIRSNPDEEDVLVIKKEVNSFKHLLTIYYVPGDMFIHCRYNGDL